MLIVALIVASLLVAAWLMLMSMASREDWVAAAYNKVLDNMEAIDKLRAKDLKNQAALARYHGVAARVMGLLLTTDSSKEIAKLQKSSDQLQGGNLKSVSVLVMPGYVLQRKVDAIGCSGIYKTLLAKNLELHGRKHAANKSKKLLAMLLSYSVIGVAFSLTLGALIMGLGSTTAGLVVLSLGTVFVLVLVYAMYDEVSDRANKRRDAISRQFPNVVSKLALLVTSGMIVDRAWKETAYSQELELYKEMQRTSEELDNLVSPEQAYGSFIAQCNTKETAKLATTIIQNLSKGNAEIGAVLKEMAREAWLERRHTAKRDADKANSKLMIPTMLLFIAILAMIMVPIAMTFSSVGF